MEGCMCRSVFLALPMIGAMGLMIGGHFSLAAMLIAVWILCWMAWVSVRSIARARGRPSWAATREYLAPSPPTGACDSCGDGRGYYIGDGRYLACKFCGGRG